MNRPAKAGFFCNMIIAGTLNCKNTEDEGMFLAPQTGLEPGICGSTAVRSKADFIKPKFRSVQPD
jgi:hypothetical protein